MQKSTPNINPITENASGIQLLNRQNIRSFSVANRNVKNEQEYGKSVGGDGTHYDRGKMYTAQYIPAGNVVICGKPRAHLSHSRRSNRAFYEPSLERFPPGRVLKSEFKLVQEMPFWRLDTNRFRRIMITHRDIRLAHLRVEILKMMPFYNISNENNPDIFINPDHQKLIRKRIKHDRTMRKRVETRNNEALVPEIKSKINLNSSRHEPRNYNHSENTGVIGDVTVSSPISKESEKSDTLFHGSDDKVESILIPSTEKPPSGVKFREPVIAADSKVLMNLRSVSSCRNCQRNSYAVESVQAHGQVYHSTCFKCSACAVLLHRGSWNHSSDKFYCNPCHRKLSLQTLRH